MPPPGFSEDAEHYLLKWHSKDQIARARESLEQAALDMKAKDDKKWDSWYKAVEWQQELRGKDRIHHFRLLKAAKRELVVL